MIKESCYRSGTARESDSAYNGGSESSTLHPGSCNTKVQLVRERTSLGHSAVGARAEVSRRDSFFWSDALIASLILEPGERDKSLKSAEKERVLALFMQQFKIDSEIRDVPVLLLLQEMHYAMLQFFDHHKLTLDVRSQKLNEAFLALLQHAFDNVGEPCQQIIDQEPFGTLILTFDGEGVPLLACSGYIFRARVNCDEPWGSFFQITMAQGLEGAERVYRGYESQRVAIVDDLNGRWQQLKALSIVAYYLFSKSDDEEHSAEHFSSASLFMEKAFESPWLVSTSSSSVIARLQFQDAVAKYQERRER